MRSAWTDERLDDLASYTREGFHAIDQRFVQMDQRFTQMDGRFTQLDGWFDGLEGRLASFQRTLVIGMFGLGGTLLATMLATVLRLG